MQYKLWKFLQYGYLAVAVIFIIEGFLNIQSDFPKALISFGFAVFIILVFLFKKKFREKVEKRNNQHK